MCERFCNGFAPFNFKKELFIKRDQNTHFGGGGGGGHTFDHSKRILKPRSMASSPYYSTVLHRRQDDKTNESESSPTMVSKTVAKTRALLTVYLCLSHNLT